MFSSSYKCCSCEHKFTVDSKSFWIGPIEPILENSEGSKSRKSIENHVKSLHCSRCNLELSIPSLLIREDWINWKKRSQPAYSKYPFLKNLVTRIETTSSTRPWRVDIGSIECPYCDIEMSLGEHKDTCPKCQCDTLELVDQWHSQTEGDWPPII